MKQLFFVMFVLLCLSIQTQAFVTPLPQVFEVLRNSGEKYEVVGTICEQVAKLKMQEAYPAPRYSVITGIAYNTGGSTVGELDVVVFETSTNSAILIGEVKCWSHLNGAISKARDQRQRFLANLGSGRPMNLECTNRSCRFSKQNFKSVQKFISISQSGGTNFGFDMDLPYSLTELMNLRQQLVQCQSRGQCARPKY